MKKKNTETRKRFFIVVHHRNKRRLAKLKAEKKLKNGRKYYVKISAPEIFCITDKKQRGPVLKFISDIRVTYKNGKRKILLDLSRVKKFIADATLLFHSEVYRLTKLTKSKPQIKCLLPFNDKACQVLKQIGFLDNVTYGNRNIKTHDDDVVNWRSASGQGAEGEKFENILGLYDGVITEALQSELYTGLTEAMTNAHHHAYIHKRKDGISIEEEHKHWWMFSQEKDKKLTVVFCDLGVGISETLPTTRPDAVNRLLARIGCSTAKDSQMIMEAISDSKSRTGKSHRGKGLTQIIETVSSVDNGSIIIHSNRGLYLFATKHKKPDEAVNYNFRDSILGTIIFWQIPLPNESQL